MGSFFQSLGYTVGNANGKSHRIINFTFLFFSALYVILSICNLKSEEPSILMLLINIANLIILILNNLTDLLKISEETRFTYVLRMLLNSSPIAAIKIFIEIGIVFTIAFLLMLNSQQELVVNSIIKDVAYLVLGCTGVENIIDFLGRLYDVHLNLNENV